MSDLNSGMASSNLDDTSNNSSEVCPAPAQSNEFEAYMMTK